MSGGEEFPLVDMNGMPVSDEPAPEHIARFTEAFVRDVGRQWGDACRDAAASVPCRGCGHRVRPHPASGDPAEIMAMLGTADLWEDETGGVLCPDQRPIAHRPMPAVLLR
jgi:hypothetical protein